MFKKITAVTFKICEYCNLDCVYCFQKHDVKTRNNKFKYFDELISFLCKLPLDDELEFKITGGEPSLFIDDIRYAYKKLKKIERYKDTHINFTTISNGSNMDGLISLMDEGILRSWGCKYSWDGIHSASMSRHPKNIDIYNDEYFNNKIKILGKSKYNKDMLVRIALTPDTVDDLANSFYYALQNGCKKLEYYYLTDCDAYKDLNFIAKAMEQFEMIAKLKQEFDFVYSNWDSLFFTEFCLDKEKDKLRSIACRHLGRFLYIEQNGKIAPCGFFSADASFEDKKLYIGDIFNGFYKDKVKYFINEYKQIPMCYNFNCNNLHCFECPATALYRKGHMADKLYQTCALRSIERDIFLKYNNKNQKDINIVKKAYSYAYDWNIDYSMPELPYI